MLDRILERQAEIKEQEYWEQLKAVIKSNEEVVSNFVLLCCACIAYVSVPTSMKVVSYNGCHLL